MLSPKGYIFECRGIVKVKGNSDGIRAGSSDEVITVTEDSNETEIVEEIMR